jgi:hypothetical protein
MEFLVNLSPQFIERRAEGRLDPDHLLQNRSGLGQISVVGDERTVLEEGIRIGWICLDDLLELLERHLFPLLECMKHA